MKRSVNGLLFALEIIGVAALLTGCGGGGGSSPTVPPTAAAGAGHCATVPGASGSTTAAVTCPAASAVNSTLSIDSNPEGLTVQLNGATVGVTKASGFPVTPSFSKNVAVYTIAPNNGAPPFVYPFQQTDNGNHALYYNQLADTSGTISTIASSSAARLLPSSHAFANGIRVRRPVTRIANRPVLSSSRLFVVYSASALGRSGKTILSIEHALGVAQGNTLGPVASDTITRALTVPAGETIDALAAQLKANSEVVSTRAARMRYDMALTPVFPNDPFFDPNDQWDMYRISAPYAWGYTTGSATIPIAVIDTGLDMSQGDFSGSKVTYAEKVLSGVVTFGNAAVQDLDGHGTNVAGIAAAATNNGFGFASVGFNTSLQIYRIFPDPVAPNYSTDANYGTNTADEVQAIYDAVSRGAKVINLSLGAPPVDAAGNAGFDPQEQAAVEYAISQGVVVVAAAGNDGANAVDFPAGYAGVISVGASGLNDGSPATPPTYTTSFPDTVATYSNYGPPLSVVAPGGDPSGSADVDPLHWISNDYSSTVADPTQKCQPTSLTFTGQTEKVCSAEIAGTSQATPHVSGAVALMLAVNASLSPAQIGQTLMSTADDIGDVRQGHGRINLYRALAALKGDTAPAAPTNINFVAFAYTPNGTATPAIVDVTYVKGAPVASNGTFRVADIPTTASAYKIGVWYDANGNGVVDAGDWFGNTATTCTASAPCAAASAITVHPVSAGFVLN